MGRIARPRDANAHIVARSEFETPFSPVLVGDGQIGNSGWNRIEPGAESQRQTQQRTLKVERRDDVHLADNSGYSAQRRHQSVKRRGEAKKNSPPPIGGKDGATGEKEHV